MKRYVVCLLFALFLFEQILQTRSHPRQKRCIVIQKQSGTHGDSSEGQDDMYDEVKDRPPKENNHHKKRPSRHDLQDAEELSPEYMKHRAGPTKRMNDLYRLRNKMKGFKRI